MYKNTAGFYDRLTTDIDYNKYAEYFTAIFDKHAKKKPHSVMDLGCGTGGLTLALAEKGYDMTGIDASAQMLSVAFGKRGPGILWINQNVTELDLFGTYDASVSLLDCVNHILDKTLLEKYFRLIFNYTEADGLFVFDINSEYKFRYIYGNNVFYSVDGDFSYIWQNDFNTTTGICTMDMTFFKQEGELYRRFDTVNREKVYSVEYLSDLLEKSGFIIEAIYDDGSFEKLSGKTERIFFVCRRKS